MRAVGEAIIASKKEDDVRRSVAVGIHWSTQVGEGKRESRAKEKRGEERENKRGKGARGKGDEEEAHDDESRPESESERALHAVCQIFCSALPCAYCHVTKRREDWSVLASLALEAAFEATLCAAAVLARARSRSRSSGDAVRVRVFLTKIGAGAFGNNVAWVNKAVKRACEIYKVLGLYNTARTLNGIVTGCH